MIRASQAIFALAVCFLVHPIHAALDPEKFVDSVRCTDCHDDATEVWLKTKHKESQDMRRNPLAREYAQALGLKPSAMRKPEGECASCHFTSGVRNKRVRILTGVSCQSCHGPGLDWVDFHDDFGGPGETKQTEDLAHRHDRLQRMTDAGMIHPADLYGLARNCTSCHLVSNQWLVNNTEHSIGSDFDLLERSQGNIRHYPEADDARQYQLKIAGLIAALEVTYASLADAEPGSRFGDAMEKRAGIARQEVIALADSTEDPFLMQVASIVDDQEPRAGNSKLKPIAQRIYDQARQIRTRDGLVINTSQVAYGEISLLRQKDDETRSGNMAKQSASYFFPLDSASAKKVLSRHFAYLRQLRQDFLPGFGSGNANTIAASASQNRAEVPASITAINVISPNSKVQCRSRYPWRRGFAKISISDLTPDKCFGIDVEKANGQELALFAETADGEVVRLLPNSCNFLGSEQNQAAKQSKVRLPQKDNGLHSAVFSSSEFWSLYAVVYPNAAFDQISPLLTEAADICAEGQASKLDLADRLNAIHAESNKQIQFLKAD